MVSFPKTRQKDFICLFSFQQTIQQIIFLLDVTLAHKSLTGFLVDFDFDPIFSLDPDDKPLEKRYVHNSSFNPTSVIPESGKTNLGSVVLSKEDVDQDFTGVRLAEFVQGHCFLDLLIGLNRVSNSKWQHQKKMQIQDCMYSSWGQIFWWWWQGLLRAVNDTHGKGLCQLQQFWESSNWIRNGRNNSLRGHFRNSVVVWGCVQEMLQVPPSQQGSDFMSNRTPLELFPHAFPLVFPHVFLDFLHVFLQLVRGQLQLHQSSILELCDCHLLTTPSLQTFPHNKHLTLSVLLGFGQIPYSQPISFDFLLTPVAVDSVEGFDFIPETLEAICLLLVKKRRTRRCDGGCTLSPLTGDERSSQTERQSER
ncbi:hypothetical protein LXL04_033602 [Taraxacum kok-saghyz]